MTGFVLALLVISVLLLTVYSWALTRYVKAMIAQTNEAFSQHRIALVSQKQAIVELQGALAFSIRTKGVMN